MAEADLRERAVGESNWDGLRFAWGENVDTMWSSVWLEIERRGEDWVVTRIDRNEEELPEAKLGFHRLAEEAKPRAQNAEVPSKK